MVSNLFFVPCLLRDSEDEQLVSQDRDKEDDSSDSDI